LGPGQDDVFEYSIGGQSGILVYVGNEGSYYVYRPMREGAFAIFYFHTSEGTWTAQNRTGNTWVFGTTSSRERCFNGRTSVWSVSKIVDPFKNMIEYEYLQTQPLRLSSIHYDKIEGSPTYYPHPYVQFTWGVIHGPVQRFNLAVWRQQSAPRGPVESRSGSSCLQDASCGC